LQVGHQGAGRFLEQDGMYFPAPLNVLWAVQADEVRQGADCCQALVARGGTTAPLLCQLAQEGPYSIGREVFDPEPVEALAGAAGGERQEQAQRVAVAALGVAGQIAFADEVLKQEAPDPRTQQGGVSHGSPPSQRSARNRRWPR